LYTFATQYLFRLILKTYCNSQITIKGKQHHTLTMKTKAIIAIFSVFAGVTLAHAQTQVKGRVTNKEQKAIADITVRVGNKKTITNQDGQFEIFVPQAGDFTLFLDGVGYKRQQFTFGQSGKVTHLSPLVVEKEEYNIEEIEVFGERNKKPKGLEDITRMPLKPNDQIQTISVISNKVIEAQGALTLTDAVRNVPGVTLFGSYGGVKESMSTRGFRGVPVLKNGVRMETQFQSAGGVVDMQGIESIQMIKGSAAITQGVITDIGNAGGVINVVTKTPNFANKGQVGIRVGSWGQVRPTFDVETVLDKKESLAVRVNGAYERADSYRKGVNNNRVYFNPSITWRASDRTSITLEADYLNSNVTPHSSAVNLNSSQGVNALYILPNNQLFGLNTDNNNTVQKSVMASIQHELNQNWSIRGAYATNTATTDNAATTVSLLRQNNPDFEKFTRSISRSGKSDKNSTVQFDLIGQDLYTGKIKHTAQVGFDFRSADVNTTSYTGTLAALNKNVKLSNTTVIDTINIHGSWVNDLSEVNYVANGQTQTGKSVTFVAGTPVNSYYNTFGILAQDVIEFNKYLKASIGVRYSEIYTPDFTTNKSERRSAFNPSVGVIVSPKENINLFASYANSTSLRSAANRMSNGDEIGASTTNQFNFTYFHIYTSNLSNAEYVEGTTNTTGYYFKAGDLVRDGIETELNGRIFDNLTVMMGYAYLNARYKNSPSYVEGSAPMNAPDHTGNAWVQYGFTTGALRNLSLSAGIYYVGARPVNEYSNAYDGHTYNPGVEPFDMPAYTTVNAQVGYKWNKVEARLYLNNLTNEIGLNSYFRGGYINQTDPRNAAFSLNYKF
jgi:iron complex outermembrane receptor protein